MQQVRPGSRQCSGRCGSQANFVIKLVGHAPRSVAEVAWYEPESLVGKQVVIVANLEPRKLRGEISQGMILAASEVTGEEEREVRVLAIDGTVPPGSRVS